MKPEPIFTLPASRYKRNINVLPEYVNAQASFLHLRTGRPWLECYEFIKAQIKPGGAFPLKDPTVLYLAKESKGNRDKYEGLLSEYLNNIQDTKALFAPTLTTYVPTVVDKSIIAQYTEGVLAERKSYKRQMLDAEMSRNKVKEDYYKVLQTFCKIKVNSISGGHASPSTILYNKSSHSTLTSTCRIATSYSNASNERFIMGNRHYWSPDVIIAALTTAHRTMIDGDVLAMLDHYNLHEPTVQDVMDCITYSSNLYWRNTGELEEIRKLVERLPVAARAYFLYGSDLYHLEKHNPKLVHDLLTRMACRANEPYTLNPEKVIGEATGDMIAYASLLCSDIMRGLKLNEMFTTHPTEYGIVAATILKTYAILEEYRSLLEVFFRPVTLPPSIAKLPTMIRRAVLTSDTDSTIFTTQYWTKKIAKRYDFSELSYAVGYTIVFLASEQVTHLLALMSANLGIPPDQIHRIKMKNEYYFPIFSLTSNAKHYYSFISACEGNVYHDMRLEVKGVNLRSSNAPKAVTKQLHTHMAYLMNEAIAKGSLSIDEAIGDIIDLEKDVQADLRAGGHRFLRTMQIKDAESYIKKDDAPAIAQHNLWEAVFAPKYGKAPDIPYPSLNLTVNLGTKTKVKDWLEQLEDRELAARMEAYMTAMKKTTIPTLRLPGEIITSMGIPEEILPVISVRKLTMDIVKPFYLLLESLGIHLINKHNTRLLSEEYDYRQD